MFIGDIRESTIEHIAKFSTKIWEFPLGKWLKYDFIPNSLTKNPFS